MYVQATINCECGSIFRVEFQDGHNVPVCPKCGNQMNEKSWKSLQDVMGRFSDFNHDILKWNLERSEPRMQVPVITVQTQKCLTSQDE